MFQRVHLAASGARRSSLPSAMADLLVAGLRGRARPRISWLERAGGRSTGLAALPLEDDASLGRGADDEGRARHDERARGTRCSTTSSTASGSTTTRRRTGSCGILYAVARLRRRLLALLPRLRRGTPARGAVRGGDGARRPSAQLAKMAKQELSDQSLAADGAGSGARSRRAQIFEQFCVACHLPNGSGSVGPNLTDALLDPRREAAADPEHGDQRRSRQGDGRLGAVSSGRRGCRRWSPTC